MAGDTNRITEGLLAPDSNTRRFHLADLPQAGIPTEPELSDEEKAALKIHVDSIKVPYGRPRWGVDENGDPIEVPRAGLVMSDPETGGVEPLGDDGQPRSGVPRRPSGGAAERQRRESGETAERQRTVGSSDTTTTSGRTPSS